MNDLFAKISSMLDNPETAEKLKEIAASVMGDETASAGAISPVEEASSSVPPPSAITSSSAAGGKSDGGMSSLFSGLSGVSGGDDRSVNLLQAIRPYMRESRAVKIDSAIRIMRMLRVIGTMK